MNNKIWLVTIINSILVLFLIFAVWFTIRRQDIFLSHYHELNDLKHQQDSLQNVVDRLLTKQIIKLRKEIIPKEDGRKTN